MIRYINKENVADNWEIWMAALGEYWETTLHFETPENLLKRLLADEAQLWLWTGDGGKFIFVSEVNQTATARVFQITHTAGFPSTGEQMTGRDLRGLIRDVFGEIEDMARELGFDVVGVHTRPAHVKLAPDYEIQSTHIVKRLLDE